MYVVSDLAGQVSCQPGKRRLLILDQFVDDQKFLKKLNHTFLKKMFSKCCLENWKFSLKKEKMLTKHNYQDFDIGKNFLDIFI